MSLEELEERRAFANFSFSAGVATLTLGANETGVFNGNVVTATGGVAVDMTTLVGLTTFNVGGDNAGNETFTLSNPLDIATTTIGSNVDTLNVSGAIGSGSQSLQFTGGNVQLVGGTALNLSSFTLGTGTSINGNASLSITTTSALSLNDVGVGTPLASLNVTAPSLTLNGDATVVGLFDVNTSSVNLTDDVAINVGNLTFDAGAAVNGAKSLSITTGSNLSAPIFGNTTPLAALTLTSAGNVNFAGSISAATLKVHSGTDGTGDITASAGVTITAGAQSYIAGDGPGGANGALVDLSTNSPTFAGTITDFRFEQDAAFASNVLPTAAQFSTARPTNYSILSRTGGITISSGDGSRVSNSAGGTLLLSGLGSVALLDSIDRGASGTILLQSTGSNVTQSASSVVTAGTISARASSGVALDATTNSATNIALQTNTGDVKYKGQGNFTLSQVAATTDYAGAAGMRSNTGNIRIQSTTAGAVVSQTASSPIEGGGLELVGNNSAFQLAAASNQIVTIAGSAGAAGISQILFRDTSGDLDVGTVGATSGLSAGVGIALQSDSGAITQSQSVATADFGVVAATGINLGTQTNNVGELSARTTAGDVRFWNQSGLAIGSVGSGLGFGGSSGASTPGLFSLEIAAAGAAVTQNVTRTINAASVELLGPVDFDLGTNANAAGALAVGGGAESVTFRNSGNLNIDTVDGTAGVTAATVKLQSDSGDLTQSATGVIAATTLGVQAQTNITLNTVDNNVLTLAMDTDAAGAINFKNDSGATLTIGTVVLLAGITSDSASTTVNVLTADGLTIAASIQSAASGALASVSLTTTVGTLDQNAGTLISSATVGLTAGANVTIGGRLEVGLGDAAINAGGAFTLASGGKIGLTIASANSLSNANVTAASVSMAGGTVDLNFLDSAATLPNLVGSITLITTNRTVAGIPTVNFLETGVLRGTVPPTGAPAIIGFTGSPTSIDVLADTNVSFEFFDFTPIDNSGATGGAVNEGLVAAGTAVGITAYSPSAGGPGIVYSLTSNPGNLFAIDPTTGVVTVAADATFDFETQATYSIIVRASAGTVSSTAGFSIAVTDVTPSTPIDANPGANTIAADAAAGTVAAITAQSSDPGGGPAVVYSLADDAGGRFVIDSATGVVSVSGTASFVANTTYTITIAATAGVLQSTSDFQILSGDPPSPPSPPSPPTPPSPTGLFATGTGAGGGQVNVYNADGSLRFPLTPYVGYAGGVTVATGDVNNDGTADVIVGTAAGAAHVKVFDGVTGTELFSFLAFDGFQGGINVAVGDVNNDGFADVIAGTATAASHVKVFDGRTGALVHSFLAFPNALGVSVGSGDVNRDGFTDIIVGAAAGSSLVKVFDGQNTGQMLGFQAFGGYPGGVSVAGGDLDADGFSEVLVGANANGHVKAFGADGSERLSFLAYPGFGGAVRVGSADVDGDGRAEILTAAGPHVKVFRGTDLSLLRSFFAFDWGDMNGVFVG